MVRQFSPHYDDVLREVSARIDARVVRGQRWSAHEVDLALYVLGKVPSIGQLNR